MSAFDATALNELLNRSDDVIHLHGEEIPDPYQHLADVKSQATQAWAAEQENLYRRHIGETSGTDDLTELANAPRKGIPARAGQHWIFYHQGGEDNQPTLRISDTPEGEGRLLVDPAEVESGNPQLRGASVSPDGKYLAYIISQNGAFESTLRIKKLESGEDIPDVIEKTGGMWWDKDGSGFQYNQVLNGADPQNYRIILKHHRLGEDGVQDTQVSDDNIPTGYASPAYAEYRTHSAYSGDQEWMFTGANLAPRSLLLKDSETGKYRTIIEAGIANHAPIADTGDGILMWTDREAPKGKVVKFDPANPSSGNWTTVIPEGTDVLKHVFWHKDRIFGVYTHEGADQVRVFEKDGDPVATIPLPAQSQVYFSHSNLAGISLGAGTAADKDDLYLSLESLTVPPTVYRYKVETNSLQPLESTASANSDFIVERLWARSKDGTKIPVTVTRRPDAVLDGTAALKLTGYGSGGYNLSPGFDLEALNFLRDGGIYAQAHVRGGGEGGKNWHDQGRLKNKQNSFDDFNGCAAHLISNGYTSPSRLVAEGSSAGGLLVLASMEQQPWLYGGVIANVPVADMLSKSIASGALEFGDPHGNREDFETVKGYCPRLNIREGQNYPPILVRAGEHDPLIDEAYKYIATMQHDSPQTVALLHVEKDFGHGSARPKPIALKEMADKKAFIERSIGPIDAAKYKKELANRQALLGGELSMQPVNPSKDGSRTPAFPKMGVDY